MTRNSLSSEPDFKRVFEEHAAGAKLRKPDFERLRQRLERRRPSGLGRTLTLVAFLGSVSAACVGGVVLLEKLWIAERIEDGKVIATLTPVGDVPFGPSALSVYLRPDQHNLARGLGIDLRTPEQVGKYTRQPNWAWGIAVQSSLKQSEAEEAGVPTLMREALFDEAALEKLRQHAEATRFLNVAFQSPSGVVVTVEIFPSPVYRDPFVSSLSGEEVFLGSRPASWYDNVEASYPPNDGSRTTEELRPTARRIQQLWVRLNDSTLVFSPDDAKDGRQQEILEFAHNYLASR